MKNSSWLFLLPFMLAPSGCGANATQSNAAKSAKADFIVFEIKNPTGSGGSCRPLLIRQDGSVICTYDGNSQTFARWSKSDGWKSMSKSEVELVSPLDPNGFGPDMVMPKAFSEWLNDESINRFGCSADGGILAGRRETHKAGEIAPIAEAFLSNGKSTLDLNKVAKDLGLGSKFKGPDGAPTPLLEVAEAVSNDGVFVAGTFNEKYAWLLINPKGFAH